MPTERLKIRPPEKPLANWVSKFHKRWRQVLDGLATPFKASARSEQAHSPLERTQLPAEVVQKFYDEITANLAQHYTGHTEGESSRMSTGMLQTAFRISDCVFPVCYDRYAGHWSIAICFDENPQTPRLLTIDSLFRTPHAHHLKVKDRTITASGQLYSHTITNADNLYLYFNKNEAGSFFQKHLAAHTATARPPLARIKGLPLRPTSLSGSQLSNQLRDLRAEENGHPRDDRFNIFSPNALKLRESFNYAYVGSNPEIMAKILPETSRLPTQEDAHKCGEFSLVSALFVQMALELELIEAVTTGRKTFPTPESRLQALATYRHRLMTAENYLIKFSQPVTTPHYSNRGVKLRSTSTSPNRLKVLDILVKLIPTDVTRKYLATALNPNLPPTLTTPPTPQSRIRLKK